MERRARQLPTLTECLNLYLNRLVAIIYIIIIKAIVYALYVDGKNKQN